VERDFPLRIYGRRLMMWRDFQAQRLIYKTDLTIEPVRFRNDRGDKEKIRTIGSGGRWYIDPGIEKPVPQWLAVQALERGWGMWFFIKTPARCLKVIRLRPGAPKFFLNAGKSTGYRGSRAWAALAFLVIAASASVDSGADSREPVPTQTTDSADKLAQQAFSPQSFLSNLDGMMLVDQHGRTFEPAALVNRVVLFNFIFTGCGSVCPLQTRSLAQVFQELPADVRDGVRFVSVSIDPANDTPEKLKQYAKTLHADRDGWSFLTGDVQQIQQLAQRLHLFDESAAGQADQPQMHRTSLWLVDRQGRMLQRYRGDPPDKARLIREITQVSHMTVH
jgi:protein SCO1/2